MKNETKTKSLNCHYSEVLRTAIPAPSLALLIDAFADEGCLLHHCARSCFRTYLWTLGPSLLCAYATKLDSFLRTAQEIGTELPGLLCMQILRDDMWGEYQQAHHATNVNEFEKDATIWIGKHDHIEVPYLQWCRTQHLEHVPSLIQARLAEESAVD